MFGSRIMVDLWHPTYLPSDVLLTSTSENMFGKHRTLLRRLYELLPRKADSELRCRYKDARRQFAQQAEDCASKSSSAALQTRPGARLGLDTLIPFSTIHDEITVR